MKISKILQEKRIDFIEISASIVPNIGAKISKIKCFITNQQTLIKALIKCTR